MGPPVARMYVHVVLADLAGFWPRSNLPHNNMHMKIFIELILARDVFVFLESAIECFVLFLYSSKALEI